MKLTVYRDQALWERQTLEIEVPDDFDVHSDDAREMLDEKIEAAQEAAIAGGVQQLEILDEPVFSLGTETRIVMPDGTEVDL